MINMTRMHKIIPYILAACCLCMVASCDTVFDVHPYDVQIDGDRNLNVTNIQKIEAAVKSKDTRSEEHTSELQSRFDLVCRLLLEKKKQCLLKTKRMVSIFPITKSKN